MREHAIWKLSALSLTSFEKVTLARDHKVAKWLKEGLSEIVTQEEILKPDDLRSHLGIETAFRLMWIQNQSLKSQVPSKSRISLRSLGCPNCSAAIFSTHTSCNNCSRTILLDDADAFCYVSSITGTDPRINVQYLKCQHCSGPPIYSQNYYCSSCGNYTYPSNFRLIPSNTPQKASSEGTIEEVFKEEIASYESWDQ